MFDVDMFVVSMFDVGMLDGITLVFPVCVIATCNSVSVNLVL